MIVNKNQKNVMKRSASGFAAEASQLQDDTRSQGSIITVLLEQGSQNYYHIYNVDILNV